MPLTRLLADKSGFTEKTVSQIIALLEEGSTIPFIARYRKELTNGATDEQLQDFYELYQYQLKLLDKKSDIKRLITEKGQLTQQISELIDQATTLTILEDIYRPYKEKRNTRAGIAKQNGLSDLADIIAKGQCDVSQIKREAQKFINDKIINTEEAISGAKDILAERFSDNPKQREILRQLMQNHGLLEVKSTKIFDTNGAFKNYSEHSEKVMRTPSHRLLAIFRGVSEKQLSIKVSIDTERYASNLRQFALPKYANHTDLLFEAYWDGYKRLLHPAIEREILADRKSYADDEAIKIFGQNLQQLLMTPPVKTKAVLGVDPGYKTGCKLAVIDQSGNYLANDIIYPTPPRNDFEQSKKIVSAFVNRYQIDTVAIGNGTGSQETQSFFAHYNEDQEKPLRYTVVSEAGASVYSASKFAQQEYPDLDVTVRGAISIAQRLQNPMAALVKIDPKALGVGQYQHDVEQKKLTQKLHDITELLVNRIGVNINTTSSALLSYVAGIGPKLAESIIDHRKKNGDFKTKLSIKKVKGLGEKAFEQCSGFLRIPNGDLLDRTGIHPESYETAKKILKFGDLASIKPKLNELAQQWGVGLSTLKDIAKELEKPGFDPRDDLPPIPFKQGMLTIEQLKEGDIVSGVVRNITDFGVFVDIGLKNDGMIHISELANHRVKHPSEIVSINQNLPKIKVIRIELERNKVGLSLKEQ